MNIPEGRKLGAICKVPFASLSLSRNIGRGPEGRFWSGGPRGGGLAEGACQDPAGPAPGPRRTGRGGGPSGGSGWTEEDERKSFDYRKGVPGSWAKAPSKLVEN